MPASSPSIAFHVGAHKTATSHLQRCLMKAADRLAAENIRYYGPDYFRQPGYAIRGLFGFRDGQPIKEGRPSGAAQIAHMAEGAQRLVLSEENYLGSLNDSQGGLLARRYPVAGARVGQFAQAAGLGVDVFIGLRQPTAYLNGAYGQILLSGQRCTFDEFCQNNPLSSIDWVDVVGQLRAAPGVRQVTVWRYEDYPQVFGQIIAGLVGKDKAPLVSRVKRRINPGLSAAAVAALLAGQGDEKHGYALRDQYAVTDGHAPFDGFADQLHTTSAADYARQIAAIAAMDDVTLLRT